MPPTPISSTTRYRPRKYVPPVNGPVRPPGAWSDSLGPSGWGGKGWARSCGIVPPSSVNQLELDARSADVDFVRGPRSEVDRGAARCEGCPTDDVRPRR